MKTGSVTDDVINKTPLYRVVIDTIVGRIASGELPPGAMLPSEVQLGAELGVSQGTARKALIDLEARGLVQRAQGRGTFVTIQTPDRALFNFFRLRGKDGARPAPALECQEIKARAANKDEKQLLHGAPERVFEIARLRSLPGEDRVHEVAVVPQGMFPGLLERAPLPNTLYVFYQQAYSCIVVRADERLGPGVADAQMAKRLGVAEGAAVLQVDRVAYDALDRAVERRVSVIHARDHVYDVTLK
ncbi:MAG: GntR family transcriptional regulator [Pseudomonadota bacterium]